MDGISRVIRSSSNKDDGRRGSSGFSLEYNALGGTAVSCMSS